MECAVAFFLMVLIGGSLLFFVSYISLRQRVKDLADSVVNLERRLDRLTKQVISKEPADSKAEAFVKATAIHQVPDEPRPVTVEPPGPNISTPSRTAETLEYLSSPAYAPSANISPRLQSSVQSPAVPPTAAAPEAITEAPLATPKKEPTGAKVAAETVAGDVPVPFTEEVAEGGTAKVSDDSVKKNAKTDDAKEPAEKVAEFLAGHGAGDGGPKVGQGDQEEKPFSFEQLLSMRLIVWLAAISVAIAGGLFVKYSAEHGLLSPPVRIAMATIFGVALIVVGHLRIKKNNYIAQGLSAAGVVTLFASVYAAVEVFPLIQNKTIGFGLMVIVAALAIALSLMHGQLVAAIGLIGGFLTPGLIHTGNQNPLALYTYLILLQVAMMAVTRIRGWSILALLTSLLSLLWVVAWLARFGLGGNQTVLSGFVIASMVTTMSTILREQDETKWFGGKIFATTIGFATFIPGFILLMVITAQADFPPMQWVFLGVMSVAALALARLKALYEPMSYLAAFLMLAMISGYALTHRVEPGIESAGVTLNDILRLYGIFGGLFVFGGYACMWKAARELRWILLVAFSALLYTLSGWLCSVTDPLHSPMWALLATGVAAVLLLMSWPIFVRRKTFMDADAILELLVSAAALLLMIPCATLNLDASRPMCFGLIGLALAAACRFVQLPRLRFTMFAALVPQVILLTARSAWYGGSFGDILLAYVPTLALAVATIWLLDAIHPMEAQVVEGIAAILGMFLVYMIVQRVFKVTQPESLSIAAQTGGYLSAQVALGYVMLLIGLKLKRKVLDSLSRVVLLAGIPLSVLLALISFANGDAFGAILMTFFPTFIIAIAVVWHLNKINPMQAEFAEIVTTVFGMFFIHLVTHHLFNHAMKLSVSDGVRIGGYVTAQLIYAFALLLIGQWLNRRVLDVMSRCILSAGLPLSFLLALGAYLDGSKFGTIVSVFMPSLVIAVATVWQLDKRFPQLARFCEILAVIFAMFFVQLLATQIFVWMRPAVYSQFCRNGTYVLAQIALAYGLMRLGLWLNRSMTRGIAESLLTIGLPLVIVVPVLFHNPLFAEDYVGQRIILNQILFVLGMPILMGLWIGWDLKKHLRPIALMCIKICVIVIAFLLISAEIRHVYHLPKLTWALAMPPAELYTYSVAWIVFGGILLTLAIITRGLTVRWASLAVILLTVAKVFLIDAANLHDLLRVLSFLGLGLALFVVAFVYQKFVFGGDKQPAQMNAGAKG